MHGLAAGLFVSAVFCLAGALLCWSTSVAIPTGWQIAAAVVLPAVCGAIIGACRQCSWKSAAAAVDAHFQLKDQASSAMAFLTDGQSSPMRTLQIEQAELGLRGVDIRSVRRCRIPRSVYWSCGLIVGACLIWQRPKTVASLPTPMAVSSSVLQVMDQIAADLGQLEQLTKRSGVTDLEPVLREVAEQLQQLRASDLQPATTLAAISEMQQKLAARQAQFNLAVANSQLQALAEALAEMGAFRAAAEQLQQQEFARSARALEKVRPQRVQTDEAQVAAARLAEIASAMKQAGLSSELSEVVGDLSTSLAEHQIANVEQQNRQLAQALDQHQHLHDIADLLKAQIRRLSEYKTLARNAEIDEGRKSSVLDKSAAVAESESSPTAGSSSGDQNAGSTSGGGRNAGASSAGNISGRLTHLESRRQLARLTGQLTGRGFSEKESVTAYESDQQPQRSQQEVFAEYELRSQNAVNSENIPLTHRETIRRYFESLRQLNDNLHRSDRAADEQRTGQGTAR